MKHKKYHDKIIILTFTITIFLIIIMGSLNLMIFNKDFYYDEYSKNEIYDKLPANITAEEVTDNIMKYFRGNTGLQYFTEQEKNHMADVKGLIRVMQFIYYGSAIAIIGLFYYCYRKFRNDRFEFMRIIYKSLIYSSIATAIFLVIIFLLAVYSFEFLFALFHIILFPQGNWTFSSDSLLITLFPTTFFFDIALRIFIYAMFQALIFFGIGYWMRKQLKMFEKYRS